MALTDLPRGVGDLTAGGVKSVLDRAKVDDAFRAELATQLALNPRETIKQVFELSDVETNAIDGASDTVLQKYVHFAITQLTGPNYEDFEVYWVPGNDTCSVAVEYHWVFPFGHIPMVMKLNLCEVNTDTKKSAFIAKIAAQL